MSPDTLVFSFGAISTGAIALVFGFMWLLDGRRYFDLAWAGAMASYAAGIGFITTRIATDAALAGDAATVMFWAFVVLMVAGNLDFIGRRIPTVWLPIAIGVTSAFGLVVRMQDSQFGMVFVGAVTAVLYFWTGWLLRNLPTIGGLAFGILSLRAAGALARPFFLGTPFLIQYSVTSFTLNFAVGVVLISGSLLQSRQLLLASQEKLRRSNEALKAHETELEETNRLLQAQAVRLERLGSDYLAALERAEQANRAKDSFIANMNHEFRTPLNAVLGFTELIQAEAARSDNKRINEYSDYAHQAGRSMLRNVDRILTFIALDSGQRPSRDADFDPRHTAQRQIEALAEMAHNKGVRVSAALTHAPEVWRCDETMFKTIIDELLRNAIKAAPKGSAVQVELTGDPGELMLRIVDTGPGLSDKFLKTVGDLFNISEHVLSRGGATQGVGLGLTIAARYARLMGGALMLERNKPSGTVARVLLARAAEPAMMVAPPMPTAKAPTA